MRRVFIFVMLACPLSACGNGSDSQPNDPSTIGTGGFVTGSGGAAGVSGGGPSGGGAPACAAGTASTCACPNGAVGSQRCDSTGRLGSCVCDTPAGQLACGGKQCRTGGHCTAAGLCPGFLGDCFTKSAGFDACSDYCTSKGLSCAAKACNSDGSSFDPPNAFTWVSYASSHAASCASAGAPDLNGSDTCTTPLWLSAAMPNDSVVRCCCQ